MIGSSNFPFATESALNGTFDLVGQTADRDSIDSGTRLGGSTSQNLMFIDAAVADMEMSLDRLNNTQVFRLDANLDGVAQITHVLHQFDRIGSVHIFSHGSAGNLRLGNGHLNLANLSHYASDLQSWQDTLTNDADVLFYGCNVGAGSDGLTFVQQFSQLTGADIAASNNVTGHAALGGDWELEVTTGPIELSAKLDPQAIPHGRILLPDEVLFAFTNFSNTTEFVFNGNASQATDKLRITPDLVNQTGTTFFTKALVVDANTSFSTQFQFQLSGGQGTNGADGFTFILQNGAAGLQSLGNKGGDLGYQGIDRSIAIEFDTYQNTFDPNRNHISILRDGNVTQALTTAPAPFDLNGGNPLNAWVDYDGATNNLQVFLSNSTTKPTTALLSTNIDLATVLGNQAFLGFTGGTGGLTNVQEIQNWSLISNSTLINNPPGTIGLENSTYWIDETNNNLNVNVLRSPGSAGTVTIDYRTVDATAMAGSDYTATTGTLTFAPGETSKSISIPILNDTLTEGNESFSLTLDRVTGGATLLTPTTAVMTIVDDEAISPLFVFTNFSNTTEFVFNGNASQVNDRLRITPDLVNQRGTAFYNRALTVDGNTSFSTQFQFQLSGGQGTDGADGFTFVLQNGAAGLQSLGNKGGDLGYQGIDRSIAIEFDTYQNTFDSNRNHISILRDGNVTQALTTAPAPFDLNGGNPLNAWVDYDGATNNLQVFLSNSTTKPTTALLSNNIDLATVLGNQAFFGFTGGTGGLTNVQEIQNWSLISNSTFVNNSPGIIGLESSTYRIDETNNNVNIDVVRSQGRVGTVSVDYRTVDATAIAGSDYTAITGTLTFAPGETSKSISIPILNDTLTEGNENFNVTIDNVTGGGTLLAPRTATITILDDEAPTPLFAFNNFSNVTDFRFNGNASQAIDRLRVTPDLGSQNGTAFYNKPLAVNGNTSFSTQFQFQLSGTQGTTGADGFTFVLQNNINALQALGGSGGDLGYRGINQSLAIEFDTYQNIFDLNNNHISILRDGNVTQPLVTATAPFDLNSGNPLNAWVDYDGATNNLQVYLANTTTKPTAALLSSNIDLATVLGSRAFLGFTGGTGGLTNAQEIQNWSFNSNSSLLPIPPSVNAQKETVATNLQRPTAIDWTPDGAKMFIAEKSGAIKVLENGQILSTPFIDLSARVNNINDRGLLDIAVHPDFFNGKPYIYALYTYDPPEVSQNTGLAGADGAGNRAGRLTRIEADPATNYRTAISGSEVVILGENSTWNNFNAFVDSTIDFNEKPAGILPDGTNLQDFLAADSVSHSIGSVEFGSDGALYVSNGDGTSFNQMDPRGVRVQDIDNLSGKILRIDPITGAGLPTNPFYNGDANANRSKVYQYGLRNPFRLTVHPQTGQVYIGDVGWTQWEEINAAPPGANFGWPYYEGGNRNNLPTGSYQNLPEAQAFYASGEQATPSLFALNHVSDGINAIVLGDIYTGTTLPAQFRGDLFFNDLGQGIVRNVSFDAAGNIISIDNFATDSRYVVQIAQGPDGNLYYVDLDDGLIGRWRVND